MMREVTLGKLIRFTQRIHAARGEFVDIDNRFFDGVKRREHAKKLRAEYNGSNFAKHYKKWKRK